MKLKAMIAEDEYLAREELAYLLSMAGGIELLLAAANGRELVERARAAKPDVVFLDIEMPEMDGVQAARRLREAEEGPFIVFTTAYDQYAVEAFKLEAVDYLLKPYDADRLRETLARVRARHRERMNRRLPQSPEPPHPAAGQPAPAADAKLLVEDGGKIVVVDPKRLLFCVKEEKTTLLHLADGQTLSTKLTLQELEEKLRGQPFFRTHRSYLVNVSQIREIEPWFNGACNAVLLAGGRRVTAPVSRASAKELFKLLQGEA